MKAKRTDIGKLQVTHAKYRDEICCDQLYDVKDLDRKRNVDISEEWHILSLNERINEHKNKWKNQIKGILININKYSEYCQHTSISQRKERWRISEKKCNRHNLTTSYLVEEEKDYMKIKNYISLELNTKYEIQHKTILKIV